MRASISTEWSNLLTAAVDASTERAMTLRSAPPETPMQALGSCQGAAWLVELRSGAVVAATPAGGALLGLDLSRAVNPAGASRPNGLTTNSGMFDAAMPALARLRVLAAEQRGAASRETASPPGAKRRRERLVYWTSAGVKALLCDVTLIPEDRDALFALVEEHHPESAPATADDIVDDIVNEARALVPDHGDAVKLKEIARRIRRAHARLVERSRDPEPSNQAPRAANQNQDARPHHGYAARPPLQKTPPLNDVIAKLAHELRTPLSAISAAAEIMKDERLGPVGNERYQGYAADIHGAARHALGVVERMLRGTGESESLEFAEIDPNEVITAVVSQLAPLAEEAGITLRVDLAKRMPRLVADATSLRQILLNLLTNAVKFTPRGGFVTVRSRYEDAGPVSIAIVDTGKGMSRRDIARYVDRATPLPLESRDGGGFGIGLGLVRSLAKANGARLLIESKPGRGTSATVVFSKDRAIPV